MPYGVTAAYRVGNRLTIEIELPETGELSQRGRAENLVNPSEWLGVADDESIRVKLTVCRPIGPFRRNSREIW